MTGPARSLLTGIPGGGGFDVALASPLCAPRYLERAAPGCGLLVDGGMLWT